MTNQLLFSIGPVNMESEILELGSQQLDYFRTEEFSNRMKKIERQFLTLIDAPLNSHLIALTGSGTAAMECAVASSFDKRDKVLIIVGGSFGERFVTICQHYKISYEILKVSPEESFELCWLENYKNKNFTGILINSHETSVGRTYPIKEIGEFAEENNMLFICDAIGSFLADPFSQNNNKCHIVITSSQKGLCLPPGMAFLTIDKKGIEKINSINCRSLYFNIKDYVENIKRGQTPFTPNCTILFQLEYRLTQILSVGILNKLEQVKQLANHFRDNIKNLPFEMVNQDSSNMLTAIQVKNNNIKCYEMYEMLRQSGITLLPCSGEHKDKMIRIGHIGNLTINDNVKLINEIKKYLKEKGL